MIWINWLRFAVHNLASLNLMLDVMISSSVNFVSRHCGVRPASAR